MRRRALWGFSSLLLAPLGASALGLGDIELRSALNQPLEADIMLVSPTAEELSDLRVALATPETFERYGLDRPGFLGRLSFDVTQDEAGRDIIRMSSIEPITEPFVTVLVEATWGRGRLLREYTVLLDPPVMLPEEAALEPIEPATARAPQPTQPAAAIERSPAPEPAPAPAPAPAPQPAAVTPPAANAPAPSPAPTSAAAADVYGPVQRGETLWQIAAQFRPAGVTMNQMMVAMYEANPAAFQGNMNILREGATLRMPAGNTFARLSAAAATQEAIRQTEAWQATPAQQARLRLLAPEVESGPATGGGTAATAGVEPSVVTALEQEIETLRTELAESQRILNVRDQELAELQQQLSEARSAAVAESPPAEEPAGAETGMIETGADVEGEQIFADETGAETEPVAEPAEAATAPAEAAAETPADAPAVAAADAPAEEAAVAPPPRAVSTQTATSAGQPSLLSRVLGWLATPLVWMVAGLVALIGAGVVYLRTRHVLEEDELTGRWEALEEDSEEDLATREATERLRSQAHADDETIVVEEQHTQELPQREPIADELFDIGEELDEAPAAAGTVADEEPVALPDVEPEPEPEPAEPAATAQAAPEETMSSQTVINLDQADPIAEADFHMAYGLYDQAADLVSKALESDPDNRNLRLKLLEVYFVWGNREAFLDAARALHADLEDSGDADWDKVVIMGKQVCPDEPLFAEAPALADSVDLDLAAGDAPALDLAFEEEAPAAVDLDLGGEEDDAAGALELEPSDDSAAKSQPLDIGERTAAGLEAAFVQPEQGTPDENAKTSPNLDIDQDTQEAPTIESAELDEPTTEGPTMEIGEPDAPTVETHAGDEQTFDTLGPDAPTMESPELDTDESVELPTLEQPALSEHEAETGERTAEIDLDDLGLDLDELSQVSAPPAAGDVSALEAARDDDEADAAAEAEAEDEGEGEAEHDVLSATGVTQVLSSGEEAETPEALGEEDGAYVRTDVIERRDVERDTASTAQFPGIDPPVAGDGADLDLDIDLDELAKALDGGDTAEQPGVGGSAGLDLDVGLDVAGSDAPTATEQVAAVEPQTMTEVGTKLDLARAYIDMGDPEGARSILEEVIDEGDSGQQQEARGLIDAL